MFEHSVKQRLQIALAWVRGNPCPALEDIRLPIPLELKLFDKTSFLSSGEIQVSSVALSVSMRNPKRLPRY